MKPTENGVARARGRCAVFAGVVFSLGCGRPSVPPVPPQDDASRVVIEKLSAPAPGGGAELCFNATDDNDNGLLEEGCAVEQGRIQFLAAWQEGGADVDLLVAGPSGQVAEVGARSSDGLTKIRDCPGEGQECQGRNQENVLLDGSELKPGIYTLRVRLEDLGGAAPPVVVRVGVRTSARTSAYRLELGKPGAEAFVRVVEKPR